MLLCVNFDQKGITMKQWSLWSWEIDNIDEYIINKCDCNELAKFPPQPSCIPIIIKNSWRDSCSSDCWWSNINHRIIYSSVLTIIDQGFILEEEKRTVIATLT